jgi:hypothetical protein
MMHAFQSLFSGREDLIMDNSMICAAGYDVVFAVILVELNIINGARMFE